MTGTTELQKTNEALKNYENPYHPLIENSLGILYSITTDGIFTYISPGWNLLLGHRVEEVIGKPFQDYVHPDDLTSCLALLTHVGRSGQKQNRIEYRAKHADGSWQWHETDIVALRDDKGRVVGFNGIAVNINERKQAAQELKQAEDALKTAENTYRNLFLNSQIGLFRLDIRTGRFLDANDTAAKFIGYRDRADLLSSAYRLSQQYVDPLNLTEALARLRAKGELKNIDLQFRKNDGSFAWIRFSAKLVDEKGWVEGVLEDIDDRKQINDKLLQSEKNFRLSFDTSPMGVRIVTEDGETIYANRSILDIYGYDHIEELQTLPAKKRYTPESYAEFLVRREKRRQGLEEPPEYGVNIVRKDGEVRHLRVFRKEILWDGEKRFQVLYADITNQKKTQEALKASRSQLRALSARLRQIREEERILMAREVHDEMGGGLSGLKMDLSWLMRKMSQQIPDSASGELRERIQAANALIDQMIGVVRRIATSLRPSILDDLGLVAALDWQAQEFAARTEIACEFITSLEDVTLSNETATDVFRIFQEALTNISRHAQATRVTVIFREDKANRAENAFFILEIRDNGRGISPEEISNLQSLGLLGMNERALAFGGELSIFGTPGEGTTIVLKIPEIKEIS